MHKMAGSLTFFAILLVLLPCLIKADDQNVVEVNLQHSVWTVSDKFLSVTIDAGSIRNKVWDKVNFTTPRMINLAKALRPTMLRVGGTSQDYLLFNNTQIETERVDWHQPRASNFTMTVSNWDSINEFVTLAGWEFIFGLNDLLRNGTSWDSQNARQLMEYTLSKGYTVNWELGNEPDLRENVTVAAEQLSKDFENLKSLIAQVKLSPKFIGGPDVATLTRNGYFTKFLQSVKHGVINAVTWHHYYTNGATAVLPDMFSADLLDKFISQAESIRDSVGKYLPGTEIWLGETSSCYGGGATILSGSFVSGFMWLDKLGVSALTNQSRVFRQDYIGGKYALLDGDFNPLPGSYHHTKGNVFMFQDYWLSVLHKRLVGESVLNVSKGLDKGRHVRVYAHCAKQPIYSAGDVVLFILNTHTFDTTAVLKTTTLASAHRDVYWLSPPGNTTNILSKQVALNGKVLAMVDNSTLPELTPLKQDPADSIQLPALTFGFYVFKDTKAPACM